MTTLKTVAKETTTFLRQNNIVFVSRKQTGGIKRALRVDFSGKCFIMQHFIIKNTSYHFVNHLRSFIATGA